MRPRHPARRQGGEAKRPAGIVLRIGINLGDVIIEGDDIYGDGVNVAARLEPLAEPGGVCVASIVNESVGNRIDVRFTDGGEVSVKNIDRPIRVWKWHPDSDRSVARPRRRAGSRKPRPRPAPDPPVDRGAAVRQHVGRPRAGIFLRRHHRGHHHRPVQGRRADGHRAQLELRLQGQVARHPRSRPRARRPLGAGRLDPPRRQPRPDHRAADRRRHRRPPLGRALRPRPDRHLRGPGRGDPPHRRRAQGEADAGREGAARRRRRPHNLEAHDCFLRGREFLLGQTKNREVRTGDQCSSSGHCDSIPTMRKPTPDWPLGPHFRLPEPLERRSRSTRCRMPRHYADRAIEKDPNEPLAHSSARLPRCSKRTSSGRQPRPKSRCRSIRISP